MQEAIRDGQYDVDDRGKNLYTLSMLGYTWKDALECVNELTVNEYFQGPNGDRDHPDTDPYWVFKKIIEGQMVYIKIKVRILQDGKLYLKSFHFDGE